MKIPDEKIPDDQAICVECRCAFYKKEMFARGTNWICEFCVTPIAPNQQLQRQGLANALKMLSIALICDVVFILWPYLNATRKVSSFTYWGGLFGMSVAITIVSLACLFFRCKAAELFTVRDYNHIGWKQAITLSTTGLVSLAAYILFEFYLEKLGYHIVRH
jgi:hypothetical protein